MKKYYIFILLFITLIFSACEKQSTTQESISNETNKDASENIANQEKETKDSILERKIKFIILGEHDMYDICYDHDTHGCINFFNEAVKRGLMPEKERTISKEEDPNNMGRTYQPNFSEAALDVRRDVLNRYFNDIHDRNNEYQELLDKIKCEMPGCEREVVEMRPGAQRIVCPTYGCRLTDVVDTRKFKVFIQ